MAHYSKIYGLSVSVRYLGKSLLKVINNSSSLRKVSHDRGGFWIFDLN